MTAKHNSTAQKLKLFAASPCSSQDFEVDSQSNEQNAGPFKTKLQESEGVTGASRKRKQIEPSTSTQCIPITNINENIEQNERNDSTWPSFISAASPIKVSSNNSLSSSSLELTHTPNPTKSSKSTIPQALHHSSNVNREVNSNFSIPPLAVEPECSIEQNTIHAKPTDSLEPNKPEIDADLVVEMATGTFPGESIQNYGYEIERGNRQFPGPAGILPRLHTGLESNPRLATLMRLHKGRDLRKFSDQTSSNSPASKKRTHTVGKQEFIDNNQLWQRMLDDDKLASEGYHELMIKFNIQFIKDSSEGSFSSDLEKNSNTHMGYITKTPLLIAAVKWIDLATGHQDPTCQLIDNTGTIYGQLSSEIIEQYGSRIQPGTVLVLRNMAILSTSRNVYVNVTMANMIALFWITPSRDNGLCINPSIFGKRICRVTKEDILRDAKLMEEEAKAEAQANKASFQHEQQQAKPPNYNSYPISPSSSTSSVPSSIRAPMNNMRNSYYNGNPNYYTRNYNPPVRSNYRPNVPVNSPYTIGSSVSPNFQNNFRTPSSNWRPDYSFQRSRPPIYHSNSNTINSANVNMVNTRTGPLKQSNAPSFINSQKPHNTGSSRFQFNPNSRSSPIPEENMSYTNTMGTPSDNSILLEGLDEDSLFGDF